MGVATKKRTKRAAKRKPGRPPDSERAEIEALKTRWLDLYPQVGWTRACENLKIAVSLPSYWRYHDEEFAKRYLEVQPAIAEMLERTLDDLATGARVQLNPGAVTAAIFRLKGLRPTVYRDNVRTEVSGPNGSPVQVETIGSAERADQLMAAWKAGNGR